MNTIHNKKRRIFSKRNKWTPYKGRFRVVSISIRDEGSVCLCVDENDSFLDLQCNRGTPSLWETYRVEEASILIVEEDPHLFSGKYLGLVRTESVEKMTTCDVSEKISSRIPRFDPSRILSSRSFSYEKNPRFCISCVAVTRRCSRFLWVSLDSYIYTVLEIRGELCDPAPGTEILVTDCRYDLVERRLYSSRGVCVYSMGKAKNDSRQIVCTDDRVFESSDGRTHNLYDLCVNPSLVGKVKIKNSPTGETALSHDDLFRFEIPCMELRKGPLGDGFLVLKDERGEVMLETDENDVSSDVLASEEGDTVMINVTLFFREKTRLCGIAMNDMRAL